MEFSYSWYNIDHSTGGAMADRFNLIVISIVLVLSMPSVGRASQVAFDTAGDSAYNNGWTQGSNGGFGWGGGWSISNSFDAFLGSSTTNGSGDPEGDGDINSPRISTGRAWGISNVCNATRPFVGPLSVGQTFSIDFDDNGLQPVPNNASDLDLLAPDGSIGINLAVSSTYLIGSAGAPAFINTGVADTDRGIHLTFTKELASFDISLTPYAPNATTTSVSVPYSGDVNAVEFSVDVLGVTPVIDTYINNMQITPEPGSGVLGAIACATLVWRRRYVVRGGGKRAGGTGPPRKRCRMSGS
jgi:hypothetical protein